METKTPLRIVLPGAFWVALIGFVTLWLPQFVPGAPWLPEALLLLAAVGKGIEVYLKQPAQPASRAIGEPQPESRFSRWLWG